MRYYGHIVTLAARQNPLYHHLRPTRGRRVAFALRHALAVMALYLGT